MAGYVDYSRLHAMVVSAEKILHSGCDHVAGRHRDVGVPTQVVGSVGAIGAEASWLLFNRNTIGRASRVVDAVVGTVAARKRCDGAPGMIRDEANVRRKEGLVALMHARRHVCPPQKALRELGAIVKTNLEFKNCALRPKTNTVHALHPQHGVVIAAPDRDRSVTRVFNLRRDRRKYTGKRAKPLY